jgi:UTP--glucose-1-phosphate uridylyltransferase
MKIRKAVITAAGWGTRFLPVTRSQPKEMLPLVDRPLIQYAVEEAINAGIEQIIMVTAMGKRAIEDYFDSTFELEYFLERKGETALLRQMREISGMVNICYVRQKEQLGLGDAIFTARNIVGEEPFAVILPDDIILGKGSFLKRMMEIYVECGSGVIAVEEVALEDTPNYGIIETRPVSPKIHEIVRLVEKPQPSRAPSRLGIVGRYILPPGIFEVLRKTPPDRDNEIQLTDALQLLLRQQKLYAYEVEGTRYDTGTPLGWLKANLALALKREDVGPELKKYLKSFL